MALGNRDMQAIVARTEGDFAGGDCVVDVRGTVAAEQYFVEIANFQHHAFPDCANCTVRAAELSELVCVRPFAKQT